MDGLPPSDRPIPNRHQRSGTASRLPQMRLTAFSEEDEIGGDRVPSRASSPEVQPAKKSYSAGAFLVVRLLLGVGLIGTAAYYNVKLGVYPDRPSTVSPGLPSPPLADESKKPAGNESIAVAGYPQRPVEPSTMAWGSGAHGPLQSNLPVDRARSATPAKAAVPLVVPVPPAAPVVAAVPPAVAVTLPPFPAAKAVVAPPVARAEPPAAKATAPAVADVAPSVPPDVAVILPPFPAAKAVLAAPPVAKGRAARCQGHRACRGAPRAAHRSRRTARRAARPTRRGCHLAAVPSRQGCRRGAACRQGRTARCRGHRAGRGAPRAPHRSRRTACRADGPTGRGCHLATVPSRQGCRRAACRQG